MTRPTQPRCRLYQSPRNRMTPGLSRVGFCLPGPGKGEVVRSLPGRPGAEEKLHLADLAGRISRSFAESYNHTRHRNSTGSRHAGLLRRQAWLRVFGGRGSAVPSVAPGCGSAHSLDVRVLKRRSQGSSIRHTKAPLNALSNSCATPVSVAVRSRMRA